MLKAKQDQERFDRRVKEEEEMKLFEDGIEERAERMRTLRQRQMRALSVARGEVIRIRTATAGASGQSGQGVRITTANGTLTDYNPNAPNSDANGVPSNAGGSIFNLFYQGGSVPEDLFQEVAPSDGRSRTAPAVADSLRTSEQLRDESRAFLRQVYIKSREARESARAEGMDGDSEVRGVYRASRTGNNRATTAPSPVQPDPATSLYDMDSGFAAGRLSPVLFA
jgi:hypothetical protein